MGIFGSGFRKVYLTIYLVAEYFPAEFPCNCKLPGMNQKSGVVLKGQVRSKIYFLICCRELKMKYYSQKN